MTTLTRPPARIAEPGTFVLRGMKAQYTIGHDAVKYATSTLQRLGDEFGVLAVDIETAGKSGRKRYDVKAVTFAVSDYAVVYDPRDPYQLMDIGKLLNSGSYLLAFHNSPFDVPILYQINILDLDTIWRVIDTLIWARLAEPDERSRKDLTNCANRYLGTTLSDPISGMCKVLGISKNTWYEVKDLDVPTYRDMAASDAILTHRLIPEVKKAAYRRLTEGHPFSRYGLQGDEALKLIEREQILNRQHLRRTCRGYQVDPEYLDRYRDSTAARVREIEATLEGVGIRPGNAGDLTAYLDEQGILPDDYPLTPKTGKPSGAKGDLSTLDAPIAREFVEHKEMVHILRDYLDKAMEAADEDGRIHPGVSLLGAATGRMSISGDAPLHQYPEDARGIILADDWESCEPLTHKPTEPCTCRNPKGMVSIDWSQIEPVVVANVAGDLKAIQGYESGQKFYNVIADFAGIPYKTAKVVLLAQLYGEGIKKLARDLRVEPEEAATIRDLVWRTLPGTYKLAGKGGKLQTIANQHRVIFTLSGRIVPVPSGRWPCWEAHEDQASIDMCRKCDSRGTIFSVAVHKGVNYFVQGSAYDLLAEAEISIIEAGLGDAIYLPMHDELVVDHEAAHDIRRIMETPPPRLIELSKRTPKLRTDMAHLGERWAAA